MVLYFQTLDSSFLCFFSPFLFLSPLKCRLHPPPFPLLYLVIMYVITVGFAVNNLIMIIIVSYPFSNTVRADFLLRMRDSKFSPVHTSDLEQLLYSPKLEFSGFKVFVSVQRELWSNFFELLRLTYPLQKVGFNLLTFLHSIIYVHEFCSKVRMFWVMQSATCDNVGK